ncbi:uncharacterized protein LOC116202597 [Punica granatum]|uniref:Uncharacterized protein LOC116202597 n=1 Tax=Punica granatum TaxID=22663 RepID=A0A218W5G8_PUNGR|nr:uncharacterized protein LOC116202597 [Punica granatum]OWM67471.1 hypothetical protein CDL15_Pgr028334 [Punica granatum]
MDFNASTNPRNRAKNRVFPKAFEFNHRKSPSFSSSSSSNSSSSSSRYFPDDSSSGSPLGPSTPLRFSSGVPFSWEKLPGIPKRQTSCKKNDSTSSLKLSSLLPLPPSVTPKKHGDPGEGSLRKKSCPEWDPFVAALMECSKDDAHRHRHDQEEDPAGSLWIGAKVTRSISDRFGFIGLYASCKSTCAVNESIVYVPPRPRRTSATTTAYRLIKYHPHGSVDK